MRKESRAYWILSTLYALLLVCSQVGDIFQKYGSLASARASSLRSQFYSHLFENPVALSAVFGYVGVYLMAHMALVGLATWAYLRCTAPCAPGIREITKHALFVLAFIITAMLWNFILYSQTAVFPNMDVLLGLGQRSTILVLGITSFTVSSLAYATYVQWRHTPYRTTSIACAICIVSTAPWWISSLQADFGISSRDSSRRPNLVVIGVDSLRPDRLSYQNKGAPSPMPFTDSLISSSTVFTDVTTPQARTFVAYMGILTGQYQTRHGAHFNLYPRAKVDTSASIAFDFSKAGYTTVYSTDESRFANIDEEYGFNRVETPLQGGLDFLLGTVFDSVATNLMLLIPASQYIVPHVYQNRAAVTTYRPERYTSHLGSVVRSLPDDTPVFFITHYCLAHWPYLVQRSLWESHDDRDSHRFKTSEKPKYDKALLAVDRQLEALIDDLRDKGILDNAWVVLLSDHGESLGEPRDGFSGPESDLPFGRYNSYGHGSFALADAEFRTVLAFSRFSGGRHMPNPKRISGPASLLDVAPTLFEIADIESGPNRFDGISLSPWLGPHAPAALPPRPRFVESGLTAAAIEKNDIDQKEVAEAFVGLYEIGDDMRFEIREDLIQERMRLKQRAILDGHFGLAAMPYVPAEHGRKCWMLADYKERTLRCIELSESPKGVRQLASQLCDHYRDSKAFHREWCVALNDD